MTDPPISNAPHGTQAEALWQELNEAYRQRDAALAERDRLRKSAVAWDALMAVVGRAREQDEDEPHPAIEPLLDKILELRDVKADRDRLLRRVTESLALVDERNAAEAARDRLRAAARAFLALLDRTTFSAVALKGPELDALRRACGE